jgi:hypothetical protein
LLGFIEPVGGFWVSLTVICFRVLVHSMQLLGFRNRWRARSARPELHAPRKFNRVDRGSEAP